MSFFNQDFDEVPQDQAEVILPPTIQWWRGDRTSKNDVLKNGGFELSTERYTLEGQEPVDFVHGANAVSGYAFKGLHLAVLAYAKAWFDRDTHLKVVTYDENRRVYSKLRLWCLVKQIGGEFLVSFSGMDSKAVEDALGVFKKTVVKTASEKAGRPFPTYAFWFPLTAGPVKEWPKGGYSTPPMLAITPPISETRFQELYIGPDLIAKARAIWPTAQAWAQSQQQPSQPGKFESENEPAEEIPF